MFFAVIAVGNPHRRKFVFNLFDILRVSVGQNLSVIDRDVSDAVVKIVARREHIVFHCGERFGRHIGSREFARRLALPVFVHFVKSLFRLLGYVEGVGGTGLHRVELVFEPFERKFGESLTTSRSFRRRADYEFVVSYRYGNFVKDILESLGSAENNRLALRLHIRLG